MATKTKKKAKTPAEARKDAFGCQLGKPPAKINAVLGKKAQTPEEIAAASGVDVKRVKTHLWYWHKIDGRFERNEKGGWRVAFVPAKKKANGKKAADPEKMTAATA